MPLPKDDAPQDPATEQDDRFPSGKWTGFFLQPGETAKTWMELILTFEKGQLRGEGRDKVGKFLMRGTYDVIDGKCFWHKAYVGKHSLVYQGYNEGKGIWGVWEYASNWKGGFRIWPEAMGDPTLERLAEELDEPSPVSWAEESVEEECTVTIGL